MGYKATKHAVPPGGVPPDSFLDELVAWGQTAPDEIFAPNAAHNDIYSNVAADLGPWKGNDHRRAVMLEVMRVLASFESSWNWNQGTAPPAGKPEVEKEAGAWQVSANSMGFPELRALVMAKTGTDDPVAFQANMKINHPLAMEYIARLLRRTIDANGPILNHHIQPQLRRDAVTEFMHLLHPMGDYPTSSGMSNVG